MGFLTVALRECVPNCGLPYGTADKSADIGGGGCYRWEICHTMNGCVEFAARSI